LSELRGLYAEEVRPREEGNSRRSPLPHPGSNLIGIRIAVGSIRHISPMVYKDIGTGIIHRKQSRNDVPFATKDIGLYGVANCLLPRNNIRISHLGSSGAEHADALPYIAVLRLKTYALMIGFSVRRNETKFDLYVLTPVSMVFY
jgi:hypothetical protein